MSEKKGFFGNLFGKNRPEETTVDAAVPNTLPCLESDLSAPPQQEKTTHDGSDQPAPVPPEAAANTEEPTPAQASSAEDSSLNIAITPTDETDAPPQQGFFGKLFGRTKTEEETDQETDQEVETETAPQQADNTIHPPREATTAPLPQRPDNPETTVPTEPLSATQKINPHETLQNTPKDIYADNQPPTEQHDKPQSSQAETATPTLAAPKTGNATTALPLPTIPESSSDAISGNTPSPDIPARSEEEERPQGSSLTTEEPQTTAPKSGFFTRLRQGLTKTSTKLTGGVSAIFTKRKLDDETLEELEDLLITADLGVNATTRITTALARDKFDKEVSDDEVRQILAEEIIKTLAPLEKPLTPNPAHKPHIILMTGVNGAGKTTTIGKLAHQYQNEGKSVMLAAGDTFRAAAIEQLTVWGERVGAPVIARAVGADAAGLVFDAIKTAQEQNIDVLMIDTAGRLQNRTELMDELAKIVRVIKKIDKTAPHDTLLVLDATVGQNALNQTEVFAQIAGISGLVMTKLDGTARGGVLVALADKFTLPIHYIGVGESIEDLQSFNATHFARALTGLEEIRGSS